VLCCALHWGTQMPGGLPDAAQHTYAPGHGPEQLTPSGSITGETLPLEPPAALAPPTVGRPASESPPPAPLLLEPPLLEPPLLEPAVGVTGSTLVGGTPAHAGAV
jgi:hypothetical protein